MTSAQIVALILSVPFTLTFTALVRKYWKSIDGLWVYLVSSIPAVVGNLLGYYANSIPMPVWIIIGSLVSAIMATGTYVLTRGKTDAQATNSGDDDSISSRADNRGLHGDATPRSGD